MVRGIELGLPRVGVDQHVTRRTGSTRWRHSPTVTDPLASLGPVQRPRPLPCRDTSTVRWDDVGVCLAELVDGFGLGARVDDHLRDSHHGPIVASVLDR